MGNRVYFKNQSQNGEIEPMSSCRANCVYTCLIGLVCEAHIKDIFFKSDFHTKRAIAKRDGKGFLDYDWETELKKFQEKYYPVVDEAWMIKVKEYNK